MKKPVKTKAAPKKTARKKAVQMKHAAKKPVAKKTASRRRPAATRTEYRPGIGAPFMGGFYAGKFFGADGKPYALIVAPKTAGETECRFKTERSSDAAARSLRDGFANSQAMNDDAHPAAKFCRGLKIGKFSDWYLPSRHEAALLAENLVPGADFVPVQTTASAFKEGGPEAFERRWYWTSTEFDAGYAWVQTFSYGSQGSSYKDWSCRVRAVRKHPL